jgi:hydrogenase expression/formation protein HypE
MLAASPAIRVLRDPTRGGLATTLNEIAGQSGVGMLLDEAAIPVLPEVDAACELLGLDPLYVANEGKLVAIVPPGPGRRGAGGDARASARRATARASVSCRKTRTTSCR